MEQGMISTAGLDKLFEFLKKDHALFAPVDRGGRVVFAEVASAGDVKLDYTNSTLSPKDLFFPSCEVICTFADDSLKDVPQTADKRVVFGMRPCDAAALSLLDSVFLQGDRKDPYYLARRENTVIITLACGEPLDGCFCTAVDGGPASKTGSDILACAIGDGLLFEAVTEKGTSLMNAVSSLLTKPKDAELKAREKQEADAHKKITAVNLDGITEKLQGSFNSPLWGSIAERCLGCGVCTYLCPTCHCFDISDQMEGQSGRRIRSWDSCQYSLFTLHASGHNPRPSKKERMRQRILHKFLYSRENFGKTFCVGCGRCVRSCPVNLDIKETIALFACGNIKGA
jgi:sulfhydrogenase subunit beta (sulfur reductase)